MKKYTIFISFAVASIFLSLTLSVACNDDQHHEKKEDQQAQYLKQEFRMSREDSMMLIFKEMPEFNIVRSIGLGRYRVDVHTHLLNDTLDIIETMFAYPIVTTQELKFYEDDQLVNARALAVNMRNMHTLGGKEVRVPGIPQRNIKILKGGKGDYFYMVYGSGFCAVGDCPEFIGIYTLKGQVVLELITTKGLLSTKYISLKEFCDKYQFERFNDPIEQEQLFP
ncbi:MAG TPA: hypothetical protein PLZ12_20740 [Saprospiraceae bacterium]|nr:hypothetical protein [Saprospiraceae bacterium]